MSKQAEFYGATRFMPEKILEARLAAARKEAEELAQERDRRAAFTPEMKLCDRLHALLHPLADCDYHYSDWPEAKGCRHDYLSLTHQLIHTLTIEGVRADLKLDSLLALMERVR